MMLKASGKFLTTEDEIKTLFREFLMVKDKVSVTTWSARSNSTRRTTRVPSPYTSWSCLHRTSTMSRWRSETTPGALHLDRTKKLLCWKMIWQKWGAASTLYQRSSRKISWAAQITIVQAFIQATPHTTPRKPRIEWISLQKKRPTPKLWILGRSLWSTYRNKHECFVPRTTPCLIRSRPTIFVLIISCGASIQTPIAIK